PAAATGDRRPPDRDRHHLSWWSKSRRRPSRASLSRPPVGSIVASPIDLPLKALVWEDASGGVWIAYNDPAWLAVRHGLRHHTADAVHAMAGVAVHGMVGLLAKFAQVAAGD